MEKNYEIYQFIVSFHATHTQAMHIYWSIYTSFLLSHNIECKVINTKDVGKFVRILYWWKPWYLNVTQNAN